MVGNEEGRVVSTEIERNPAQGSNLKVPNTKVILFCVAAFLLIVAYILMSAMFQGQKQRNAEDSSVKKGTSFSMSDAESIIGGRDFGLTQPLQIPSVNGVSGEKELPTAPVTDESNHDQKLELHQPIEPKFTLQAPPAVDDVNDQMEQQEAMQIRQLKIEKFRTAVDARTRAEFNAREFSRTSSEEPHTYLQQQKEELARLRNGGADELFNQRMAQIQGANPSFNPAGESLSSGSNGNNRTMTDFESRTPDPSRWFLQSQVIKPAQYSILTGTVIPATLVTGINSDIPGQVTAQVSQNVYDTARGKYLLIPQGSRLIGGYSANVIYGQERLLLGWQRIIFPDGRSIDIGSMPGTDQAGYSGVTDEVNNHYLRLYGSSLMLSVISAGSAWAADRTSNDNDSKSFSNEFASSAGSQMSQTLSELIRKNMNIAPTLTVRPGFRLNVMVTKDITVRGVYKDYQY